MPILRRTDENQPELNKTPEPRQSLLNFSGRLTLRYRKTQRTWIMMDGMSWDERLFIRSAHPRENFMYRAYADILTERWHLSTAVKTANQFYIKPVLLPDMANHQSDHELHRSPDLGTMTRTTSPVCGCNRRPRISDIAMDQNIRDGH